MSLPFDPFRPLRAWLPAACLAWAAAPALAAAPNSLNRVVLDGCSAVVTAPGIVASGLCEANGNAGNRTAGDTVNGNGDIQARSEARTTYYAWQREVRTSSLWLDTLVYLGGAVPDRLVLEFELQGTLATEIVPGTLSPPGTERGSATARLTAAAMPQATWGGPGDSAAVNASLSRAVGGSFSQTVARTVDLALELDQLAAGALLSVYWSVDTTAVADNDWTRDGAGSVVSTADIDGGLSRVRWLDATGRDLGGSVNWAWTHRDSDGTGSPDPLPVPLPGSAALAALGLGLLALRRRVLRAAGAAGLAGAAAMAPAAAQTTTQPNIAYCAPQGLVQQLDLHLPDPTRHAGPRPLAVYVHGGGWTSGSRTDPRARPEIEELQSRGYVVAAVGYRLAPAHPFPAALDDVRCAVRFLRAQATRWSIDPQRVVAWGTSAGGHIAALLAYARPEDGVGTPPAEWAGQGHQVRAVALMYAPLDLPTLFAGAAATAWGPIFGTEPAALARYSPASYVRAGSVPTLLVHGSRDTLVPAAQSLALMQRLQQADVPAQLQLVARAGHSLDLTGGAALYPGRGDIARQVGRFFDVETQAPSDAVRASALGDAACVAEWLPTRRGSDFSGAHAGLQTRAGAAGPLTVRSWAGSQAWWATDGASTWVGGGRFGAGVPDSAFAVQLGAARAADCGLDARR